MDKLNKAIFLDRDGVINHLVLNPKTNEYEAPHKIEDLQLFHWTIESLKKLLKLEFKLFIVSNQPDFAKGKTSLESLKIVHNKLHSIFVENNIRFTGYYYCHHHPNGIIPEYTTNCNCRKPGTQSLEDAKLKYKINMQDSWFIGDRDTDIYCGQKAGTKTILVLEEKSKLHTGKSNPDFKVKNLKDAVSIIENQAHKR